MSNSFETELRDRERPIALDLGHEHRPLLVAFGGMMGGLMIPPFEFFHLTKGLDINKIFIRDLDQCWYHAGLPGVSNDIEGTAAFLRHKIDEQGIQRVVFVGNSMGGYAAILFGILVGADLVHAFVPHTSLNDPELVRSKDRLQYLHENFADGHFDLKKFIERRRPSTCIHVHFGGQNEMDTKHALHLEHCRHVFLHAYPHRGHPLVRGLRDSGKLHKILLASVDGSRRYDVCPNHGRVREWLGKLFAGKNRK